MVDGFLKTAVAALAASVALASAAQAGGFSRGTADTEIIYEDGDINFRSSVTAVFPERAYTSIAGAAATDGKYSKSYVMPSFAFGVKVSDSVRCSATYAQPFGADAEYGPQSIQAGINAAIADGNFTTPSGTDYARFSTTEVGLTCGFKMSAGKGNFWFLGGAFLQSIKYEEASRIGAVAGPLGALSLEEGHTPGFRLGAAYEIPDIALRVQAMYRSAVEHKLTGTFDVSATPGIDNPSAFGSATMPQSFEVKAQSGIAPGWLAFGSVKWTDWSVLQTLNYFTTSAQQKEFFYKDGWTVTGGVAHRFNEKIAASFSVTWDSGVSTTEDVNKDSYTFATGVSVSDILGGELRLGGALIYLTGGSVAQAATCNGGAGGGGDCGDGVGAKFANSVGNDWAYALSGSYRIKF